MKASKIDILVSAPLILYNGPEFTVSFLGAALQLSLVQQSFVRLEDCLEDRPTCDEGQEG